MIQRALLAKIADQCFMNKAILLLGARQVGKTTLLKNLVETLNVKTKWLNADEADIYNELTAANTSTALLQLIGPETKLAIIDEAQQIADIGLKLKLLHDNKPELQMIATGSSAFDLLNRTNEPLTGRKRTFYLYPISYAELVANTDRLEAKRTLEARLIFGSYPEVINNPGTEKNVLISNDSPVEMRFDKGALWENFLISERLKRNHYVGNTPNTYFWRTHDQAEIDYIEEQDGVLNAFEFKWKEDNVRFPDSFLKAYPNHQTQLINRDNFESFVGGGGMS